MPPSPHPKPVSIQPFFLSSVAGTPSWGRLLTEFQQPAFSVWIEESVSEVIAIIFWDLKGLVFNALIEVLG